MLVLYVSHQKESFAKYRWHTYNRWQVTLIPVVSSSGMTHANVVDVPAEEYNRYITYITTYPSSEACAFNTARIALHTLRERIHVLRKRPQDIPRSPRHRCAVMTSYTTDTQPLPYDRDCPQANRILMGWVCDSHHLTGGYLPSRRCIVTESKLHKVRQKVNPY
jgi:hypothetical protein